MLKVENNIISLTRGDTALLNVEIVNNEGEIYELEDGDICEFTLKKYTSSDNVLIKKEVVSGEIKISPDDTKNLDYGQYFYDVQVTMANGDVATVIPPTAFNILEEVNFE
ncbi:hypothetical protein [Longibaculum muris]|uniref:hypothetical protein n=1 Tax=Longibaculum muris TaxID=1796628 RepID=UPI002943B94B|nr:hypothetical protein [Longibaculum muris]